jgi:hypothetical protein
VKRQRLAISDWRLVLFAVFQSQVASRYFLPFDQSQVASRYSL